MRRFRDQGQPPWRRDIQFLAQHHTRPYLQLMGKSGKWGGGQAPWKDDKSAQGRQDSNAYWSYWSGAWKAPGSASKDKDKEQSTSEVMQQFPAYSQIKVSTGAAASRTIDVAMEISDAEDGPSPAFVKLLQRLLNSARRAEAKIRKLTQDKDTKKSQWEEFQQAMRARFIEQRGAYNKDLKSIDKELGELAQQRQDILLQIQEAVAGGGQPTQSCAAGSSQPSAEDLEAWNHFVDVKVGATKTPPDDEIIRRALQAAHNPTAFLAQVKAHGEDAASAGGKEMEPMSSFMTPQRKGTHATPLTPVLQQVAAPRQTPGSAPPAGEMAGQQAQYGHGSPALVDPYVTSPMPGMNANGRTSRSPPTRRSPVKPGEHRPSVKDGARPVSVARVAQERLHLGDVLPREPKSL